MTTALDPDIEEPYVRAVIREIRLWNELIDRGEFTITRHVDTVYFGGGTPSVMSPDLIAQILEGLRTCFLLEDAPEITLEINPSTIDKHALALLRNAGVNRASLGIQSLHDAELRAMARGHSVRDALTAFDDLRAAGFDNVSVDLIAGFPGQTRRSVQQSVEGVLDLKPEHVSVYLLEVKPGTPLDRDVESGNVPAPDDDLIADMYQDICAATVARGYDHYEIANFSLPGHASRHNLKYWQDEVFLGIGAAAHGMTGRHRYAHLEDITDYARVVNAGSLPFAHMDALSAETRFKDALIMGLRLVKGIDLHHLGQRYGVDAQAFVSETVGDLSEADLYVLDGNMLRLTDRGRLLSNVVFSRWV